MSSKISFKLASGSQMPAVGLGTWEARDDEEIEQALNKALELGYRHIDTAWSYDNEIAIGRVLQKWFLEGKLKREDLFITTKLPIQGVHPDRVEQFIKGSLAKLQLDYLDLYLTHCPLGAQTKDGGTGMVLNTQGQVALEDRTDHAAVWKKMEEQVEAGRAKNIGISNYNISQIQTVLKTAKIKPANLQVELHVYLQQKELVDFCHQNGISVVAYSPLGNPGYNKFLKRLGKEERQLLNVLTDPVIAKIAQNHNKSPAQIALRFLVQRNIAVIPKSVTPKRIQENIELFDFTLDDSEMGELAKLDVGEEARVCDWKVLTGIENHPDYPFGR